MKKDRPTRRATSRHMVPLCGSLILIVLLGIAAAGCSSSSSSNKKTSSSKTFDVGLSTVLSGPLAQINQEAQGAIAYFKAANEAGGINGYKFNWTSKDNGFSAATSVAVARSFAQQHVDAMVLIGSAAITSNLAMANELKTPLFALTPVPGAFGPPTNKWGFGDIPTNIQESILDARFIISNLNIKNFALAYEGNDVGIPLPPVVSKYAQSNGATMAKSVELPLTITDYAPAAAALKASGAKAVLAYVGPSQLAPLQKATAAIGYHPTWVSWFAVQTSTYYDAAGSLVDGVYSDNLNVSTNIKSGPATAYLQAVNKYFPTLTGSALAQIGYDAAAIIGRALKLTTDNGRAYSNSAFLNILNTQFKDVQVGLLPGLTYSASDHSGTGSMAMFKLSDDSSHRATQATQFVQSNSQTPGSGSQPLPALNP